jgi:TldD protein
VLGRGPARRARPIAPRAVRSDGLDPTVLIDSTDVQALVLRAIDVAKTAGAEYADVRLSRLLSQSVAPEAFGFSGRQSTGSTGSFSEAQTFSVAVRVRVRGGWGIASSPYWTPEEMVALVREAAVIAKANAPDALPHVEWMPIPVAQGHWTTPIKVDPFTIPIEEKLDLLRAWQDLPARYRGCYGMWGTGVHFGREERAVATSEGAYFTQALYQSGTEFLFMRRPIGSKLSNNGQATARGLNGSYGAGWELFTEADLEGQLPALYEAADPRKHIPLPVKQGEVGRYDLVLDAGTTGSLLERTLGAATHLDRAIGYMANADWTSYLGPDPLTLLGSFQAASPLVTVTANRSMPRGIATVKWDDEGVEPEDFTLIKDGVLVDYLTTRDLAPVLAPYYQKLGKPVRSHGCAEGIGRPALETPNLVLAPGKQDVDFAELVASTAKGIALVEGDIEPDFQLRTGVGSSLHLREIVNGKLGAQLKGLEFLFRTADFWKALVALGGAKSVVQYASRGRVVNNGTGAWTGFSVRAVPAKFHNVDFVDPTRKA